MIFSSIDFFIFFTVILLLMILIKSSVIKRGILLAGSYYFYAYWDSRFALLMLALTSLNYYAGLRIEGSETSKQKTRWLAAIIAIDLAILGFFKYFNFFINSLNALVSPLGVNLPLLEIILPVGISFITFEVISYVVDIYRGVNKSTSSFWDFALLVAFFPHLIAGPILKPKQFFPEIEHDIVIRWKNVSYGLQVFLLGLVRKVVIADRLAMFVDPVFRNPQDYSSITLWLAVIAYAIQIYCDFCGYTDMAIGSAKCLGFDIPKNFDIPYISQNVTEFWRRWHISLSTWLRDYLYIPLGGNRKGKGRLYFNLLVTMLLGGLWHGASWNFVFWGGLHGIALIIHKLYIDYVQKKYQLNSYFYKVLAWLVTMMFICITWVFFRSANFAVSSLILQKMFYLTNPVGINWYATALLIALPIFIISDYVGNQLNHGVTLRLSTFRGMFVIAFVVFGLVFLAPQNPTPFIYFQF